VEAVEYDDDGFELLGYLAVPVTAVEGKTPAVVVLPDWDGNSGSEGYESLRATMLADAGYIGFNADIYGKGLQDVPDFDQRTEQTTLYRSDPELFVSRIQAAVNVLVNHPLVDSEKIAIIGYCFGGTGTVDYAFSGLTNAKVVVPFHGGLNPLRAVQTDDVYPYVLIQSGGIDDAHGNNTELEMQLNGANADWEITRYSGVDHGFTAWPSDAYDATADSRSWWSMLSLLEMVFADTDEESGGSEGTTDPNGDNGDVTSPNGDETSDGTGFSVVSVLSSAMLMSFMFAVTSL
jgi:dienelactone hydrolase